MKTDIKIAQSAEIKPISNIARKLKLSSNSISEYGRYKAKILNYNSSKEGKLILVTAMNPTKFGEGKTTTSIGLADGISRLGKKACVVLREPSQGPVFGIKGGAAGGGYSQVVPMEDINLHFTGDFHAITAANNLIAAVIDNHIFQGNELNIDSSRILWKRCLDVNDRALREVTIGQSEKAFSPRQDHFDITAASEIMAILALSKDIEDLKRRIGNILIAYSKENKEILCKDLLIENAVTVLLKDAIHPNLVQTLESTPAIIHCGPFANIAHGCNSVIATKTALSLCDYTVTEAGFGADLGVEKFIDIKSRVLDKMPEAIVLVVTMRAIKHNGGAPSDDINKPNLEYIKKGILNVKRHIENLKKHFRANVVVSLNKHYLDNQDEINYVQDYVEDMRVKFVIFEGFEKGGDGAVKLAEQVILATKRVNKMVSLYDLDLPIYDKINIIAKKIYRASRVNLSKEASEVLEQIKGTKYEKMPVCIAKTQYSFSDDAKLLAAPVKHQLNIKRIEIKGGAEFLVAIAGNINLMPGLPKVPNAQKISIDESGIIKGLF